MAFWKCSKCGRNIGDDEYTSRGRTEKEHLCMDCFWKKMNELEEVA